MIAIMSLGGSPQPLIKSISSHRPAHIIFLASHDSVALAGAILGQLDYKPTTEFEITDNPNLLFRCYTTARNCVERARRKCPSPEDVLVDYTGGTKVMSAALLLATAGYPFKFNYVGGKTEDRTKEGLGTVVDGHEVMFAEMNPWAVFAEEERRQVVTLFNRRRFSAVVEIIENCTRSIPYHTLKYFNFVRPIAEGLLFWDQFNHKVAHRKLTEGLAALQEFLQAYPDPAVKEFENQAQRCREYVANIYDKTNKMATMHMILVEDILNNARRRIVDCQYDDAAARIYRAIELYGQIIFEETAGCPNNIVNADVIPEKIRADFIRKYRDDATGMLQLPQMATFQYLQEKNVEAGHRFMARMKEIRIIQHNRNYSILAHGIRPIDEKTVNEMMRSVQDFMDIHHFIDFPLLP